MKRLLHVLFAVAVALAMVQVGTQAHFQLVEPAPWINLDNLGNPQKVGPCGGNPNGDNDAILSGVVTEVTGGSKLHLKIQETIFHSGHYRVALSVNSRNELPADPTAVEKYTDRGLYSVWGVIQSPPQIPDPRRRPVQALSGGGPARLVPARDPDGSLGGRHPHTETSTARSARCRSSSSWPTMCTTSRAATPITTAPI